MDYLQQIVQDMEAQLNLGQEVTLSKEQAEEVLYKIKAPEQQQQFFEL